MEKVLSIVTLNASQTNDEQQDGGINRVMNHDVAFPFRPADIPLPQCNTGYVYMLLSLKDKSFIYIGATNSIRTRLQSHNSGNGSQSTEPIHLRPFALLAYICVFDNRRDLMFHIECQWKINRDHLIRNGVNDAKEWAAAGEEVSASLNVNDFGIEREELRLVKLYND